MSVISKYAEYILKVSGDFEQREDNTKLSENYVSKDELMLRGNNRKNIYNYERVRIGNNGRKR